jgi:transcriptional regulator GlxA family with amidase domain
MRKPHQVVLVAYEGALILDIAGPLQAFATANELAANGAPPYELAVASRRGGAVTSSAGLPIITRSLASLRSRTIDTLIVVGGPGVHDAAKDARLLDWLRRHAPAIGRVCSVCTGAFLLSATGLLTRRRVATHWRSCAALQAQYPDIAVETDAIFVRDGRFWTSAGVTAGIDMALALIQEDLGRETAMAVARRLVVFLKRPGGQSQFSAALETQSGDDGSLSSLQSWMADHLDRDLRVETLAAQLHMSPRHFARVYTAKTGTTPAKAVEAMRVEAARRALEDSPAPLKTIAHRCGFGDEERLRRTFIRRLGVSPSQYRSRFSA